MKKDTNNKLIELAQLTSPLMNELLRYAYKPNYCEIKIKMIENKATIDLEYNCKDPKEINYLIKSCEEFGLKLDITSMCYDSDEQTEDINYSVAIYNKQRNFISYLKVYGNLTAIKEK